MSADLNQLIRQAEGLAQQEDWGNRAVAINQRIIEFDPSNVPARTRLAKCRLSSGRSDAAGALYEEVLRLDPDNRIARNWIEQSRTPAAMAGKMRPSVARERQRGEEEDGARRQSVSIFREVFPVIRELILTESPRLGRPVDRDDIGPRLERHPGECPCFG